MSEDNEEKETSEEDSPYSMNEEILRKRARKPDYGRISTQLFAGIIACTSSISFGTALGWSGPITHYLSDENESLGTRNFALLVSMMPLGCSFGISAQGFLMKQMGPKKTIKYVALFYILTWWLMLIPDVDLQLAGRWFLGFLGIIYVLCGECLLQQTVHYAVRRYISVFHNSAMLMGMLISSVWGTATGQFWLTVVCGIIPIIHFCLIVAVPESPVFLYATSHVAAAKSLAWYRGPDNIHLEMANIRKDWDAARQDSEAYGYMLLSKVVYKGLLVVVGVIFFQVFSGYYVFLFYHIHIWTTGAPITNRTIDTAIIGCFFVLAKIFWGVLHAIFTWRVRRLLIASCLMTAMQLTLLAVYLVLCRYHVLCIYWFPFLNLGLFLFFYDMGLNFYAKILLFEYMPFQVFRLAFGIAQAVFWLLVFFNVFAFAMLYIISPNFIIFSVLAFIAYLGALFCYFFVVEPKSKSLIQVQLELGGNPIGRRGALYNQTKIIV